MRVSLILAANYNVFVRPSGNLARLNASVTAAWFEHTASCMPSRVKSVIISTCMVTLHIVVKASGVKVRHKAK